MARGYEVVSDVERAYTFCEKFFPVGRAEHTQGICQVKDGEVISAVLYAEYNGPNIFMHVAASPGRRWMTRHYLHEAFKYPFVTLGVKRITGWVEASNMEARKFDEHLGFRLEAVLEGAASDGGDVLLYVMKREWCRYA